MNRRSFFGVLFAPILAKFAPAPAPGNLSALATAYYSSASLKTLQRTLAFPSYRVRYYNSSTGELTSPSPAVNWVPYRPYSDAVDT